MFLTPYATPISEGIHFQPDAELIAIGKNDRKI
jgi:hypothetical protein